MNTSTIRLSLLSLPLLLMQAGCTALTKADCDPSVEKDAITKTRCLGLYEERVQDLELTLQEQRELKPLLEATLAAVQKEKDQVRSKLKANQQEYAELNAAVNGLTSKLRTRAAKNTGLQKSIRDIEAQLAQVNQPQAPDAGTLAKQTQLDQLKQQVAELQKELGQ